jgi:hypothetical protein
MTPGGRIPNLSGDCRVFVGFFLRYPTSTLPMESVDYVSFVGFVGFLQGGEGCRENRFSAQVAQVAWNCLKRWT